MKGYIAVADDLLFHDQTVTVGATLTVNKARLRYALATDTRFGSGQQEQRIWKTFHHADTCDAYSTLYLYSGCFGESPIYRRHIFEVELGGNVVTHSQRNNMWSCDTVTILREVTWDTVKVNKTNIQSVIDHRARTFDGPFTCEAICDVLADVWRMMAKLHPWVEESEDKHLGATLMGIISSYAPSTSEWVGTQVCDVIHDTFQRSPYLTGDPVDHIEYMMNAHIRNPNLSLETRVQARDDIRRWVAEKGYLDTYGLRGHVVLLPMSDFLDYIPRTVANTVGVTAYSRALDVCNYLKTCTPQEVNRLLEVWLDIKTPQDVFHCRLPKGTSEELVCRLLDSTEYQAARYDIEETLANLNPYNEHNYHSEHAIRARIVQGDIPTMEDNIQTNDYWTLSLIIRFGTEAMHRQLMRHKDGEIRASVAKYACADVVHALRTDKSAAVRAAVAHRGFDEDLDVLVHDRSTMVRHHVLDSARTTDIKYLKHDTVRAIRTRAEKAIIQL